jgi:hypothetical protein
MGDAGLQKRLTRAETKSRQTEVLLNEKKAELISTTKALKEKSAEFDKFASDTVYALHEIQTMQGQYERNVGRMLDNMDVNMDTLRIRVNQAKFGKENVDVAVQKVERLNAIVSNQRSRVIALTEELDKTKKELVLTKEELHKAVERQQEEIEKVSRPLRKDISHQMELVAKEKRQRKEDREAFAMLWPEGTEMPSLLQLYYIPNAKEREVARQKAMMEDLRSAKGEEVKRMLALKAEWVEQEDDFERVFYLNQLTEEMVFDVPVAMEYTPPVGWDEEMEEWKTGWDVVNMRFEHHDPLAAAKGEVAEIPATIEEWQDGSAVYATLGADGQATQFHPVSVGAIGVRKPHKKKKQKKPAEIGRTDYAEEDLDEFMNAKIDSADGVVSEAVAPPAAPAKKVDARDAVLSLRDQIEEKLRMQDVYAKRVADTEAQIKSLARNLIDTEKAAREREAAAQKEEAEAKAQEIEEQALAERLAIEKAAVVEAAAKAKEEREAALFAKVKADVAAKKAAEEAAKDPEAAAKAAEAAAAAGDAPTDDAPKEGDVPSDGALPEGDAAPKDDDAPKDGDQPKGTEVPMQDELEASTTAEVQDKPSIPPAETESAAPVIAEAAKKVKPPSAPSGGALILAQQPSAPAGETLKLSAAETRQFEQLASGPPVQGVPVPAHIGDMLSRVDAVRQQTIDETDPEFIHQTTLRAKLQETDKQGADIWGQGVELQRQLLAEVKSTMNDLHESEREFEELTKKVAAGHRKEGPVHEPLPEPQPPVFAPDPLPPLEQTLPPIPKETEELKGEALKAKIVEVQEEINRMRKEREAEEKRRRLLRAKYEEEHAKWQVDETARGSSQWQMSSELRVLTVQKGAAEDRIAGLRDELQWWRDEIKAERERQHLMKETQGAYETERAKQMVESVRSQEAMEILVHEKRDLEARVKSAKKMPELQATNRFERAQLEEEATLLVKAAQDQLSQLNVQVKSEEERRLGKRAEELASVDRRLMRLDEEHWQHEERMAGLQLVRQQRDAERAARAQVEKLGIEDAARDVVVDNDAGGVEGSSSIGSTLGFAVPDDIEKLEKAKDLDMEKMVLDAVPAEAEYEGDLESTEVSNLQVQMQSASAIGEEDEQGRSKFENYAVIYWNEQEVGRTNSVGKSDPKWKEAAITFVEGGTKPTDIAKATVRFEVFGKKTSADADPAAADSFIGSLEFTGSDLLDVSTDSTAYPLSRGQHPDRTAPSAYKPGGRCMVQFDIHRLRDDAAANKKLAEYNLKRETEGKILASNTKQGARVRVENWRKARFEELVAIFKSEKARSAAMRKLRSLSKRREHRWRDAVQIVQIPRGAWMSEAEETRFEEKIGHISRTSKQSNLDWERERQRLHLHVRLLMEANSRLQREVEAGDVSRKRQVAIQEETSLEAIDHLKTTLKRLQAATQRMKNEFNEERAELRERAQRELQGVEERLRMWTVRAHRRGQWVETLRTELMSERQHVEELKTGYSELQKRRADEVLGLRHSLLAEQAKCDRLYLWVKAMKAEIHEYEALLNDRNRQMAEQKDAFEASARKLKWNTWRHAVTAQRMHTDVDALFEFFVQGLANMAGAGHEYNEKLRSNRGVEVLVALCHTSRAEVKRKAAQALGMLGWDGFIEPRMLGWVARQTWGDWVELTYKREQMRMKQGECTFDDPPAQDSGEMNTAAERPSGLVSGRRRWALRMKMKSEGPNMENQKRLGEAPGALDAMMILCKEKDYEVQSHAANALAIASMYDANNTAMGKNQACVRMVIELLINSDDVEVQKHAAAAVANIGYKECFNQEVIGKLGGVNALIELCRKSQAVDVLETASAALANCLCNNDENALRLGRADGIEVLLDLALTQRSADIIDIALYEDVQANAAEALSNMTRGDSTETAQRIQRRGVAVFVQMCASKNPMVQLYAPLVLGNIAQNDANRLLIGEAGGIEAIMLLVEIPDENTQRNGLWALSNLAWAPDNQERIGCFIRQLMSLCASRWLSVQENALAALANALFFHENNRKRVGHMPGALQQLIDLCNPHADRKGLGPISRKVQEHACRALGACVHNDENALLVGEAQGVEALVALCHENDVQVQRYAALALVNLAVHDINKRRILNAGGVEALVKLHGSPLQEVRDTSGQALEILADCPADEELASRKADFGVEGMIQLCKNTNPLVQGMAAEALAEEVWNDQEKQQDINKADGVDALLGICHGDKAQVLVPALWALRNLAYENHATKTKIGSHSGVETLLGLCAVQGRDEPEIMEASLAALVNVCIDHEKNSRRILAKGLDILIEIAETAVVKGKPNQGPAEGKTNGVLAQDLLQIIGPYNFVVCANCKHRNAGGSTCETCGHAISFDLDL